VKPAALHSRLLVAIALTAVASVACNGGGEDNTAQIAAGQELYAQRCAYCHEVDGAVGPRITPRIIRFYRAASNLYNYVQVAMPYDAPAALSEQEYWHIVAYMLSTEGLLPSGVRLSAETADEVSWGR
jgi:cytochrome c